MHGEPIFADTFDGVEAFLNRPREPILEVGRLLAERIDSNNVFHLTAAI
jgi:hypothetical protein